MSERGDVADRTDEVARGLHMRTVGRVGLAGYGVVHLLVAGLAVQVAFGETEQADKTGALAAVAATGPGLVLLWVIVGGLAALVVWQLAEAALGHRDQPPGRRALRTAIHLVEVAIFGTLAWSAGGIAASGGLPPPGRTDAGLLFALPGGRYLVGLAGVGVLALAGLAVYRGVTAAFLRELDLRGAGLRRSLLVTRIGRAGWAALGLAYGTIGVLLVVAAVRYDPEQPIGLDTGLKTLGAQPFGPVLLVVLALGLALFGVHCLLDAHYRKA